MNKVILMGRLCRDPELKYVGEKNFPLTRFVLAVNRNYKNSEGIYETDFIDCDLWGKRAEIFCQYMTKGRLVAIEGSLRLNKYINKKNDTISKIRVLVDNFNFVPSSKKKVTNSTTYNSNDIFTDNVLEGELSESDIPF